MLDPRTPIFPTGYCCKRLKAALRSSTSALYVICSNCPEDSPAQKKSNRRASKPLLLKERLREVSFSLSLLDSIPWQRMTDGLIPASAGMCRMPLSVSPRALRKETFSSRAAMGGPPFV